MRRIVEIAIPSCKLAAGPGQESLLFSSPPLEQYVSTEVQLGDHVHDRAATPDAIRFYIDLVVAYDVRVTNRGEKIPREIEYEYTIVDSHEDLASINPDAPPPSTTAAWTHHLTILGKVLRYLNLTFGQLYFNNSSAQLKIAGAANDRCTDYVHKVTAFVG
jgi:hypothetical protein